MQSYYNLQIVSSRYIVVLFIYRVLLYYLLKVGMLRDRPDPFALNWWA